MAEGDPKQGSQPVATAEQQIQTLDQKKLDAAKNFLNTEPSKKQEKIQELIKMLANPEALKIIKDSCGADIKRAHSEILQKQAAGKALEGWEGSLLDLHNILFGAETIAARLEAGKKADTGKVDKFKGEKITQIKAVLQDIKNNPDSVTNNVKKLEDLMSLDLNKAEFKNIMNELMSDSAHRDNIVLKTFITNSIEAATKKGFSIEGPDDIKLLSASPKWKEIIEKSNPKIEPKENAKFIAIGDKIMPILSPSEKWVKGTLMFAETDFDHFNLKDGVTPTANALKQKIEGGKLDLTQLQAGIDQLINSNNPIMKGLGEFFKFFGKLLGFYKDGEKIAPTLKKFPDGLRVELLGKILSNTAEKDIGYDITKVEFSNGELKNPKEEKNQKYLSDLQKMLEIDDKTKDENGKEILQYGQKTKDKVLEKQKELFPNKNEKHTGCFDKATTEEWLKQLKPEEKKPEPKAEPKAEPKIPEAAKSTIPENKSNALKLIEGKKTYKELIGSVESRKAIQTLVGTEPDGKIGPKTRAAIKALQSKLEINQDGNFGPKTRDALLAKKDILAEPAKPTVTETKK